MIEVFTIAAVVLLLAAVIGELMDRRRHD